MSFSTLIKHSLTGQHFPQEYLCLSFDKFIQPFSLFMLSGEKAIDISDQHCMLGYKPVLIGLTMPSSIPFNSDALNCSIQLRNGNQVIGSAKFEIEYKQTFTSSTYYVLKLKEGNHQLIASFYQNMNSLIENFRNKPKGNISIDKNSYRLLSMVYSVPRIIRLVTIGESELYNLFPTDLNGKIDDHHFSCSFRIDKLPSKEIVKLKRLVISDIHSGYYKEVYAMGKNHSRNLSLRENFPFSNFNSEKFDLPIPEYCIRYRELELMEFKDHSLHRIFFFKTFFEKELENSNDLLAHIHRFAAEWRLKNHIPSQYLVR
jgi:hypothetical protein